jgi:uncharacterized membrane protein
MVLSAGHLASGPTCRTQRHVGVALALGAMRGTWVAGTRTKRVVHGLTRGIRSLFVGTFARKRSICIEASLLASPFLDAPI